MLEDVCGVERHRWRGCRYFWHVTRRAKEQQTSDRLIASALHTHTMARSTEDKETPRSLHSYLQNTSRIRLFVDPLLWREHHVTIFRFGLAESSATPPLSSYAGFDHRAHCTNCSSLGMVPPGRRRLVEHALSPSLSHHTQDARIRFAEADLSQLLSQAVYSFRPPRTYGLSSQQPVIISSAEYCPASASYNSTSCWLTSRVLTSDYGSPLPPPYEPLLFRFQKISVRLLPDFWVSGWDRTPLFAFTRDHATEALRSEMSGYREWCKRIVESGDQVGSGIELKPFDGAVLIALAQGKQRRGLTDRLGTWVEVKHGR
jgi:hypothetical protein